MEVLLDVLRLLAAALIAFVAGKLVARLKLPSILGWLIAGMIIGPHALGLLGESVLDSRWFGVLESLFECVFGLMIGTELIWKRMKKAGPQILVTTLTESLGTFLAVSLVFGTIFWFTGTPLYMAFLFGGIALATAPAPSLSVVSSLKADGPVTRTLIPMAALDDLVGAMVFFLVVAFVSAHLFTADIPVLVLMLLVFLPWSSARSPVLPQAQCCAAPKPARVRWRSCWACFCSPRALALPSTARFRRRS